MSEELKIENGVELETGDKCKSVLLIVLSVISLLFSITALTVSIITVKGGYVPSEEGGKVVISKQFDKGKSLDKALATKKPVLVFFYTDWCGYCQRFAPDYHKVSKDKEIKKHMAVAYVNCEDPQNRKFVEEYEIKGFPTVFVVGTDGKKTQIKNNYLFEGDVVNVVKAKALNAAAGRAE